MNATRALEIAPSGHFIGSCEVEDADISGVYEGDLSVRGRLIVHKGGRVVGKISYGELELERGGEIAGELSVRNRQRGPAAPAPALVRPRGPAAPDRRERSSARSAARRPGRDGTPRRARPAVARPARRRPQAPARRERPERASGLAGRRRHWTEIAMTAMTTPARQHAQPTGGRPAVAWRIDRLAARGRPIGTGPG